MKTKMKLKTMTLMFAMLLGFAVMSIGTEQAFAMEWNETDNRYEISNYDDLKAFAQIVNNGNTGACAKLTADIECDDELWEPIGNLYNPYTGTFDGDGHTITALSNGECRSDYQGLFGYIGSGGIVKNVGLKDISIKGDDYVGGVAGSNEGTITNCYNTGSVNGNYYVGGVAGWNGDYNGSGTIESCYNTGAVTGDNSIGGVAGYNIVGGKIESCYSTGAISGKIDVGGVAGFNVATITNCFSTGDVKGNERVGGVAGWNNKGIITNCYYDAELCKDKRAIGTADDTDNVKGLTTEQMTGTGALNNMPFVYGTGETSPWMTKANDTCVQYYPHLEGFLYDTTKDPDDWPPTVLNHTWSTEWSADADKHWHECTACGEKKDEAAHIEEIDQAVSPTCTETGLTEGKHCSECELVLIEQEPVDATGHKYGAWTKLNAKQHQKVCLHNKFHVIKENHKWDAGKVTKKATEKATGIKTYTCTVCNATKTETVPKLAPKATPIAKATTKGKTTLTMGWDKVEGAEGYDIFFSRCDHKGKKVTVKNVKTIKGNKIFSWTKKGLKKKTAYKAYVKAYVMKDGKKKYISKSPDMHAYTGGFTKKYTNAKAVKVNKTKVTLKQGKKFKIKAKVIKLKKNKKLMPASHVAKVRYISSDKTVATVSKSGKITAKGKGTCTIVAFAHNGVSKNIKVTVK